MGSILKGFTMAFGAYIGVAAASALIQTVGQHVTVSNTIEDMVEDLIQEAQGEANE